MNSKLIRKNNNICDKSKLVRFVEKYQPVNWRYELLNTTTHCLPRIADNTIHWFERLFWRLSFCATLVLMYYLLSPIYDRFSRSPTVMSVEMDYFNWNISYPAITLCPTQKIDETAFKALVSEYEQFQGMYSSYNVTAILLNIVHASLESSVLYDTMEFNQFILPEDYASIAARAFKRFDNTSQTTSSNLPVSFEIAMTEVGMCHVINSNVAVFDNPLKWDNELEYVKTNIELSSHDADFFAQFNDYDKRYKVYIHYPDEAIHIKSPSYNSKYEGYLTFGLHIWSTRTTPAFRLNTLSVRKCRFTSEPLVGGRYPIYSYNHCIIECRIRIIKKLCGCVPHYYKPLPDETVCYLSQLNCVQNNKKQLLSLSRTRRGLDRATKPALDCGCVNNCETDLYQIDERLVPQSNINRLRVGITSFPKVRFVRDVLFGLGDIVLKSGGVINLCIGSSILSLLEIIVIIIKVIMNYTVEWIKKNKNIQ